MFFAPTTPTAVPGREATGGLRARLARRQRGASQPRAAARHARGRALPHGGAGRPRRAMRRLCPHPHRLQLLPQPALSQVPVDGGLGLAGGARGRAPAGPLLPRGVHATGRARRPGLPEQGQGLRPPAQGRGGDADHDRRRSQAPGRPDRRHRRAAQLGPDPRPPPACPLHRAGRRDLPRWRPLDRLPAGLLPAGAGALAPVPGGS